MNAVEMGEKYPETGILVNWKISALISALDLICTYKNYSPTSILGHEEFKKARFIPALKERGICFKERPTKRKTKTGIVERKNER